MFSYRLFYQNVWVRFVDIYFRLQIYDFIVLYAKREAKKISPVSRPERLSEMLIFLLGNFYWTRISQFRCFVSMCMEKMLTHQNRP